MSHGIARVVDWLRAGYPQGVPDRDYIPLMALLRRRMSDDDVTQLGRELAAAGLVPASRADVGVAITKLVDELPSPEELARVAKLLSDRGWPVDPSSTSSPLNRPKAVLHQLVLGVSDLDRATQFWSRLLDYRPRPGDPHDGWCTLEPRWGVGTKLALMVSESPPDSHPRMHLDLAVYGTAERDAVTGLVGSLGGHTVDWDRMPHDPDFVVVEDTEGNRFCVVDLDHRRPARH